MKVAVIQMGSTVDKEKNLVNAQVLVKKAVRSKASFILLPETFNFRGEVEISPAEKIPGKSINVLCDLARHAKVYILAGSIFEKVLGSKKAYNSSVLIDPRGKIVKKYRKINLFSAKLNSGKVSERKSFIPGKKPEIAKAGKFTVGMSVCYDLRFPELYRKYASQGANVLVVPSSFTHQTGKAHWEVLLRARAIENFCYVLAPNQVGKDNRGIRAYGNSMIIDPWGKVMAKADDRDQKIIYAQLDADIIKKSRSILG